MAGSADPVELLRRWEQFGGTWEVISRQGSSVTVSLRRCDGGEEVQRLTFTDPVLATWSDGRTSST